MNTLSEIAKATETYNVGVYAKFPVAFAKGSGCKLYDTEGKEYTDFLAGIAVNALGYGDPQVAARIRGQAENYLHLSNLFYSAPQAELLEKLLKDSPYFQKGFLANSGAEANEAAAKLARKYFYDRGEDRFEFITLKNSFHGRTLLAATLTGQEKYSKPFAPLPPGVTYVEADDREGLEAAFSPRTAAVLLEIVQGEGGVLPLDREFVRAAERLCRQSGALLIIDEIQTGMGRTGKFFGFEHYGIRPDIATLAKALGGGLPLSAMLCRAEIAQAFTPGSHGTTFGGNPLACAAGCAVLDRLKDGLLDHVRTCGDFFTEGLKSLHAKHPGKTRAPRGLGLMLGLPLAEGVSGGSIVARMLERGFILNCAGGNTLRFLPPLVVTPAEIAAMLEQLDKTLSEENS